MFFYETDVKPILDGTNFLVACYATLHPAMSVHWSVGRLVPFWAAAPKGSMTYAFTHMGDFLLLLLLSFGPQGQDLGLLAEILTLRLRFGPQDWDVGLKTGIWALRLGFEGGT